MSWLRTSRRPRALHIPHWGRAGVEAYCSATFPDPHLCWVTERVEGERVCKHCARSARLHALRLLAAAEGRVITDPTVRRRDGAP